MAQCFKNVVSRIGRRRKDEEGQHKRSIDYCLIDFKSAFELFYTKELGIKSTQLVMPKSNNANNSCLVCSGASNGVCHFGVQCCRACASFFHRTMKEKRKYNCRWEQNCQISNSLSQSQIIRHFFTNKFSRWSPEFLSCMSAEKMLPSWHGRGEETRWQM